jgi:4-hydroxy-3-methylbut-2-enyl diphosphate reductase
MQPARRDGSAASTGLEAFDSEVIARLRAAGNVWRRPWGQIRIPRVFGFCRGVKRALATLQRALPAERQPGTHLVLLGEIIHNPWVNDYFRRRGVRILTERQREQVGRHVSASDCAVIPAFGVPLPIERALGRIGCRVIDTTCGVVRRLWHWAEKAVAEGFGVLIYGRARHDETVVTTSRLADAGGRYVVVETLAEADRFARMIARRHGAAPFQAAFGPDATNARDIAAFERLAQVSQTTMLYDETMQVRDRLRSAFQDRFGREASGRLRLQPDVCPATQDRQAAAVALCRSGCDLVVVVGGFGSSNTRHLYELARRHCPALFIEGPEAIVSAAAARGFDPERGRVVEVSPWCADRRPVRIGVLAGASSPEVVVGRVIERLTEVLETRTTGECPPAQSTSRAHEDIER